MAVAVGLDIGSTAVRAAAVAVGASLPVLRRFGEVPLPPGAVAAGSILDGEAVSGAIKTLWKRHRLPRRRVVVGVAGRQVAVHRVEVPRLPEEELVASLPGLLAGRLPVPVEDVVLDHLPLAETTGAEGEPRLALLVVAVPREVVESLLRVVGRAGVEVMSIDLQAFGLVRGTFGAAPALDGDEDRALLDIGGTLTQVAVVRDGLTCFVRHLPIGGVRFTDDLAEGAGLAREEAEERKCRIGVAPGALPFGADEISRTARLLTAVADDLIDGVRASLGEYAAESGERRLSHLVVSGNGARLPHLAHRLGRSLGLRVEPARVLDRIAVGRTGLSESQLLALQPVLPASVGLALWDSFAAPSAGR